MPCPALYPMPCPALPYAVSDAKLSRWHSTYQLACHAMPSPIAPPSPLEAFRPVPAGRPT